MKLPLPSVRDVGADGVGVAGEGRVEQRDGCVAGGSGDARAGVAGGVGGEEIDVCAGDGLLSAMDVAFERLMPDSGLGGGGRLESAAGEKEEKQRMSQGGVTWPGAHRVPWVMESIRTSMQSQRTQLLRPA